MYGKIIRLSRLINHDSGKVCIVPMDHGITTGPIDGLDDIYCTLKKVIDKNL